MPFDDKKTVVKVNNKEIKDESDLSALADDFERPKAASSVQQATHAPKATTLSVESKTANEIDLDDLNETTLLKYPIEAHALDDLPAMHVKPSHNDICLRWCYYSGEATDKVTRTNMARYKAWGFEFASVDDVEDGENGLGDGLVNDSGKILCMDVVLMKINKIRLMGHYKAGLLKSLNRVDQANDEAVAMAKQTLGSESDFRMSMARHPTAEVEFYNPMASRSK